MTPPGRRAPRPPGKRLSSLCKSLHSDPHPSVAEAKLVRLLSEQTGLPSAGDPAVVRGHAIACTGLPEIKGEGIETLHRGLACSINYTCYILVNT